MNDGTTRVQYFTEQFLRTVDFEQEQIYHNAMRRRHNVAHHRWGIVYGLDLCVVENELFVMPGMAVDGFGRELILSNNTKINTTIFDTRGADEVDVWLEYDRIESQDALDGYVVKPMMGEDKFDRAKEEASIRVSSPDPGNLNRREPNDVNRADLNFAPFQTAPDEINRDWPVFLGQFRRDQENPQKSFVYTSSQLNRPYVGLKGQFIAAPTGKTVVQLDRELEEDTYRFAVHSIHTNLDGTRVRQPHFTINDRDDQGNEIELHGNTKIDGGLVVQNGGVEFAVGQAKEESDQSKPWQIYRVNQEMDVSNGVSASTQMAEGEKAVVFHNQLRVEIPRGEQNEVAIGFYSRDTKKFEESLTIGGDSTVKINGNLIVTGSIQATAVPAALRLSADAENLRNAAFLSGIGGASPLIDRFYDSVFEDEIAIINRKLDDEEGRAEVVTSMLKNVNRSIPFLTLVVNQVSGQSALIEVLNNPEVAEALNSIVSGILGSDDASILVADNLIATKEGISTLILRIEESSSLDTITMEMVKNETIQTSLFNEVVGDNVARAGIVNSLIGDSVGRSEIFSNLENTAPKNRLAFSDLLVKSANTNVESRAAIVGSLLGNDIGRDAIFANLENTAANLDSFRKALVKDASTNVESRAAIADSLLGNDIGRDAIFANLENTAANLDSFRKALVKDASTNVESRAAIVDSLLGNDIGRDAVFGNLENNQFNLDALSQDLVDPEDKNPISRATVVAHLLRKDIGRSSIVENLTVSEPANLDPILAALAKDESARNKMINEAFMEELGQQHASDKLFETSVGLAAITTTLAENDQNLEEFVNALVSANLVDALKEKLPE